MKQKNKSWHLALCGVFGALSIAVMLLGAVIPLAMFIAPAVAGLLVMFAYAECGMRMALTLYFAVSLLGVILVPDKEVALLFVFLLGYWPLIKPRFDAIRWKPLCVLAKIAFFNVTILAMYALVFLLFPAEQASDVFKAVGLALAGVTLLIGNISFILYDKAMCNLLKLFRLVLQPKLHRLLGIH